MKLFFEFLPRLCFPKCKKQIRLSTICQAEALKRKILQMGIDVKVLVGNLVDEGLPVKLCDSLDSRVGERKFWPAKVFAKISFDRVCHQMFKLKRSDKIAQRCSPRKNWGAPPKDLLQEQQEIAKPCQDVPRDMVSDQEIIKTTWCDTVRSHDLCSFTTSVQAVNMQSPGMVCCRQSKLCNPRLSQSRAMSCRGTAKSVLKDLPSEDLSLMCKEALKWAAENLANDVLSSVCATRLQCFGCWTLPCTFQLLPISKNAEELSFASLSRSFAAKVFKISH